MDIGINAKNRKILARGLSHILADTYTLYLKTHFFHWNVTGSMFQTLHLMFEEQYNELALAVDQIAERIRALDFVAPGSYSQYAKLTSIKESRGVPEAKKMVRELADAHEILCRTLRKVLPSIDKVYDQSTSDLLTQRLRVHEKTAWMLRSLIK